MAAFGLGTALIFTLVLAVLWVMQPQQAQVSKTGDRRVKNVGL